MYGSGKRNRGTSRQDALRVRVRQQVPRKEVGLKWNRGALRPDRIEPELWPVRLYRGGEGRCLQGACRPHPSPRPLAGKGAEGSTLDLDLQRRLLAEEVARIDHAAVLPHLEVHVGTGGTARRTGLGDFLAGTHQLTDLVGQARVVGVTGDIAIAVVDLDHVAVARAHARVADHAI